MKNSKIDNLEFYTSALTAGLLYILTILQYIKQNPYWWIILIVSLLMSANVYVKYKNREK